MLAIGALLFDLGVQVTLIAHQTLVYRLDPGARSRLNAVLFVGMFTGMASGAALGSLLLAAWGWAAVMGLAAVTALAAWGVRVRAG
jgi:predicted MFS family arabinose efflux permease